MKALFVSDLHLGTEISKTKEFLKVLKGAEKKYHTIYLVGDIIDMIAMKQRLFWKKDHNKVIQRIIKLSKKIKIVYLVGNHDIYLETLAGESFGKIEIKERDFYTTIKGDKYLVMHGHQLDGIILQRLTWLYHVGNTAYDFALFLNKIYNYIRKRFGMNYFSLSLYLKLKVKNAVKFISDFDKLLIEEAKRENCTGVIYGHIHHSNDSIQDGYHVLNTGCFTEFCSYIEEENGIFTLINIPIL